MDMDLLLPIVEGIGVVGFATAATLSSAQKRTDVIGTLVLSLITCFAGGAIRDLTLGLVPRLFCDVEYYILAAIASVVTVICFSMLFNARIYDFLIRHENDFLMNFTDAVGLAVFTVCGVQVAVNAGFADNKVLLIYCGVITGVGGGILRDVFSAKLPRIFRKHIYLLPTVLGACIYTFIYPYLPNVAALLIPIVFIVIFRLLAMHYKWNLPVPAKVREKNDQTD